MVANLELMKAPKSSAYGFNVIEGKIGACIARIDVFVFESSDKVLNPLKTDTCTTKLTSVSWAGVLHLDIKDCMNTGH